ncbi:MAG: chemotaxis protein MotB [Flavobacteriales bacterium]|jgi:chemotaxis protein MotB
MMLRRANLDSKISHERWLVSYADFITLLFAFFVVMYSISQVNENKYKQLSETLGSAFSNSSQKILPSSDIEPSSASLDFIFEEVLESFNVEGQVKTGGNENWIELSLNSESLFESGKAQLNTDSNDLLRELALTLASYSDEIQIIGHTDNVAINNAQFKSNWELSTARAVSFVQRMQDVGVAPERLSAVGYGEYRPRADNATADGRSKNRRLVIRITKAKQGVEAPQEPAVDLTTVVKDLPEAQAVEGVIKPVRLRSGDLLFSSDPDLPRSTRE